MQTDLFLSQEYSSLLNSSHILRWKGHHFDYPCEQSSRSSTLLFCSHLFATPTDSYYQCHQQQQQHRHHHYCHCSLGFSLERQSNGKPRFRLEHSITHRDRVFCAHNWNLDLNSPLTLLSYSVLSEYKRNWSTIALTQKFILNVELIWRENWTNGSKICFFKTDYYVLCWPLSSSVSTRSCSSGV